MKLLAMRALFLTLILYVLSGLVGFAWLGFQYHFEGHGLRPDIAGAGFVAMFSVGGSLIWTLSGHVLTPRRRRYR